MDGEDLVLAYLPRGGYFGEMGLLQGGVRTATCVALDHVEVVRILAPDFHEMLDRFPEVRAHIVHTAEQRARENTLHQRRRNVQTDNAPLHQFLEQGLMDAQSLLVLDLEKCTRCDQCVKACADAHDGVTRLLRDGVRFENYLVATSCRQCRDPRCMIGCPVGSIRRRNSLEVIIEDWCVGCGLCATNCPYGNITVHEFDHDGNATALQSVQPIRTPATAARCARRPRCDLCHDLAEPSCVYACPHDAAHRVKPNEFFAQGAGRRSGSGGGLRRQEPLMRIDQTHKPWMIVTLAATLRWACWSYVPYAIHTPVPGGGTPIGLMFGSHRAGTDVVRRAAERAQALPHMAHRARRRSGCARTCGWAFWRCRWCCSTRRSTRAALLTAC